MIVAVNVCKAATAAIVGTLAIASGRNMVQTRKLCRAPANDATSLQLPDTRSLSMVDDLQSMSRKQLVQLFLHKCEAPTDIARLEGDWNGNLLCNNGLTRVTRFITNRLFGKGRQWNGKSFVGTKGCNRFERFKNQRDSSNQWTVTLTTEEDRTFRCKLAASEFDQNPSLRLEYQHDNKSLLWNSMVDEVGILNDNVLIGMGNMGWSGGMLNSSPFCLYRKAPSSRF